MDSFFIKQFRKYLLVFIVIKTLTNTSNVLAVKEECIYDGDICAIDFQECLLKHGKFERYTKECSSYDIVYGPGRIYETRGEIPFFIKFANNREKYPEDLTYRIIQRIDRLYVSIDDCCSVGENDSCILPTLENHNTDMQYVFVPLLKGTDVYCWYPIYEVAEFLEWCDEESNPYRACKVFKDGELKIENTFVPLSTGTIIDYCFFEAPAHYIKANRSDTSSRNEYTREVTGITNGVNEGEIRIGNKTHACEFTKDVKKHFAGHKRSASKAACVFTKTAFDNKWDLTPTCTIPPLKDPPALPTIRTWTIIVTVVVTAAVLISIAFFSLWIYRKHIKSCFPDYEKTIKELPNKDVINDNEEQNYNSSKSTKQLEFDSEIPDLIVALDIKHHAIEQPENALDFNTEITLFEENKCKNEKPHPENVDIEFLDFKPSTKDGLQDEIMQYVKKEGNYSVIDCCVDIDDFERKKSNSDSGFSQTSLMTTLSIKQDVDVCGHHLDSECSPNSSRSSSSEDVTTTQHELTVLDNAFECECDGYTTKNNVLTVEFAEKTIRLDFECLQKSSRSSSCGDIAQHGLTPSKNVVECECDGYTPKNNVFAMNSAEKINKAHVSPPGDYCRKNANEVLLNPQFKSIMQIDNNAVIKTHLNNSLSSNASEIPLITDGYTPK